MATKRQSVVRNRKRHYNKMEEYKWEFRRLEITIDILLKYIMINVVWKVMERKRDPQVRGTCEETVSIECTGISTSKW